MFNRMIRSYEFVLRKHKTGFIESFSFEMMAYHAPICKCRAKDEGIKKLYTEKYGGLWETTEFYHNIVHICVPYIL